jgi:hypothetical protein
MFRSKQLSVERVNEPRLIFGLGGSPVQYPKLLGSRSRNLVPLSAFKTSARNALTSCPDAPLEVTVSAMVNLSRH